MKLFLLLLAISCPFRVFSETLTVIEQALHQLPSAALADLPGEERQIFIDEMLKDGPRNMRLDIENQFLEYYSDGETPFHMSSMLFMKVFTDANGDIVLCHMPKPHADSKAPRLGQTFFFRSTDGHFVDVTKSILPKGVDTKWMFQPRRAKPEIELGPYKKKKRNDGRGYTYIAKSPTALLVWTGHKFELTKLTEPPPSPA